MNNKPVIKSNYGFTLLEILIAMAVFAIMSVMAYSGLRVLLDARARTSIKSERLAELQMTLYLLNEDLAQMVQRPVRDEFGTDEPGFRTGTADELLTLTRNVPSWSQYQSGSRLQRVSYRFEQDEAKKYALYRVFWTTLDRTQQSEFRRRKLLNLKHIQLRFFDKEWTDLWSSEHAPKAIEIAFDVAGYGEIKRLFFIHD